jgi:Tol biopolymer transport system component
MTLAIDPLTGEAIGPPRQVTIDSVSAWFDISPDGKWIAYTGWGNKGRHALKIIPSTGGNSRTIADPSGRVPMWSADGRSVYYVWGEMSLKKSTLMRVPVVGGNPVEVFSVPRTLWIMPRSANKHFLLRAPVDRSVRALDIVTLDGSFVGKLPLPGKLSVSGISTDGRQILATREGWVAPLTVLPVAGGPSRQLNEIRAYDEPMGWSADGKKVLFETELNGQAILLYAPIDGGPAHEVKLPGPQVKRMIPTRFVPVLSADGNHLLYADDVKEDDLSTLMVYSIEENISWELSDRYAFLRGPAGQRGPTGAGGSGHRDGSDFLFYEHKDGQFELRRSPPQGPSQTLWTFARKPPPVAVHGTRIAYFEHENNKASLFLAFASKGPARRIFELNGFVDSLAWSPDGRMLAAYHHGSARTTIPTEPEARNLIVLEVTPSGNVVGQPRSYDVPSGHWWGPQWLPDSRSISVVGNDGNLWLIPLDPSARPVDLTEDDPNSAWRFQLSPDGRHVAYPSERQQGGSIWLMNLKEPLANNGN